MAAIKVALAEDNVLLREGISRLVAANQDFELVGTASDLPELLAVIERQRPRRGGHRHPDAAHRHATRASRRPPGSVSTAPRSAWWC